MSVPETTVDKNNSVVFCEYDIRFPGKFFDIQAVPEPFAEKVFPDEEFGFGVLGPDA